MLPDREYTIRLTVPPGGGGWFPNNVVMQADDVVYVQPNAELARGILQEVTPLITLLTTTILVVGIVQSLK